MSENLSPLRNWIPYQLMAGEEDRVCRWLYLDNHFFTEPFFDETISHCRQEPCNSKRLKCVTGLDILPQWAQELEHVPPSAFIFHVSRCGSTLASQLLALAPAHIVLSEVPFFDELLRWGKSSGSDTASLLAASIAFYTARRKSEQTHSFIKTDSWHLHFYPLLRQMYPDVPFILLYRHPAEVIRSQQKRRGVQSVPGLIEPELFGFSREEIQHLSLDGYMALVLEHYFNSMLMIAAQDPLAFLIDYKQGPVAMMKTIAGATGVTFDEVMWKKISERSGLHAKYPDLPFREEALTHVDEHSVNATLLYEKLESLRCQRTILPTKDEVVEDV